MTSVERYIDAEMLSLIVPCAVALPVLAGLAPAVGGALLLERRDVL